MGEAVAEFRGARLGDARNEARLDVIAGQVAFDPGASLPRQAGSEGALEATYRFLSNRDVSFASITEPHVRATVARCAEQGRVVVAHDTTEFNFGNREGLGRLSGNGRGFLAHFAVAVTLGEQRLPLGVLHVETISRPVEEPKKKRNKHRAQADESTESLRWNRGAKAAHQLLEQRAQAIHVMDREADNYLLLAEMLSRGQDFVVRASYDRVVESAGGRSLVKQVLESAPVVAERVVPLSRRGPHPSPRHRQRHPPREAHTASVQVSAIGVRMVRPQGAHACPQETLELNLVRVLEVDSPAGAEPVEWLLWTTLPVTTADEVFTVVDAYRGRWVIEEYFKSLKTGCAYEKRQLESFHALLNALAVFVPVAWLLLRLKTVSRLSPESPGLPLLNEVQRRCLDAGLRRFKRPPLPDNPTSRDIAFAVAGLAGHIKNNGDPGWQTLGSGLDRLLLIELGYLAAKDEM